ncbi:nuclear condensing complex subunit [Phascolomyces articulosus]|uniref:Nuclear condensing complex subunit n=1 Tax=Phascolomyces articulosus TaxID=60185 RepID=A0AAD5PJQ0_9FUNG|nr:nuclear condensing complex subunit [Phascolomyces articulosus]
MDDDDEETVSSRFIEYMLKHLLRGLPAKTKAVRLRCCQIIALSINSLGEIDEELYQELRSALFERIRDKEASIRIQAATALSRLQSADDEVDQTDGKTITKKLLWLLQHDPSAEVRRVVLFNLDITEETIPYIIERGRDIDGINRRVVFLKPMVELADFRDLSIEQRHQLLKWGLKDRDPLVRRATSRMIANEWIRHADNNLLEFLERMDVVGDGAVSEDMLHAFLDTRPDIVKSIKLDDPFWENLSTESALMAKVLIKFLKSNKDDEKLDEVLPTVTRMAFIIQHYNDIWQQAPKETEADYEFIMGQLLDLAKYLDYADEVGRRKMFVLLRDVLMAPDMPDEHMVSAVELFKIISLDERDFVRTIIEIISDIEELSSFEDVSMEGPSKKLKISEITSIKTETGEVDQTLLQKMLLQLKCLSICKFMLERTEESLQDNSTLYGVLNELIVPSVQSKEAVLREEGLHCLGLCCTLDKTLGHHNILLFAHCINNGHEQLQQKALMILFDLMMTYGVSTVETKLGGLDELQKILESCVDHDSAEIQGIAVEGLSKLMLTRMFKDEYTLKMMVLLYFFPTTFDNEKIQQCLSYFFPAYAYSSAENQNLLAGVTVSALIDLCETHADLEKDEKMAPPVRISDMLADWTDPRKIEVSRIATSDSQKVDKGIQADIAYDLLKAIHNRSNATIRKTFVHMLLKLHIAEADYERLDKLKQMIDLITEEKPIKEAAVRNSFNRFMKSVEKYYETVEKPTEGEENENQEQLQDGDAVSERGSVAPMATDDERSVAGKESVATAGDDDQSIAGKESIADEEQSMTGKESVVDDERSITEKESVADEERSMTEKESDTEV